MLLRQRSHYFVHGGWFERERQLLEDAHKIAHIPTTIVQGVRIHVRLGSRQIREKADRAHPLARCALELQRYDLVCPAKTAWELQKVQQRGTRLKAGIDTC